MKFKIDEFSKFMVIFLTFFSVVCVADSYILSHLGLDPNTDITNTMITSVMIVIPSYFGYQMSLKISRNKNGIDSDGIPFSRKSASEIFEEASNIVENDLSKESGDSDETSEN